MSYSLELRFWLGLIVRMYDGCARMRFSTRAPAEDYEGQVPHVSPDEIKGIKDLTLIRSLAVGGRFLLLGSGRSGKRP